VYSYFVNGQVAETEMGGAFSFGHPLVNLESGPNLMPFGLVQIVRLPRGVQKIQVPSDDPEKIYHGPDNTEPPRAGMVRTLRVLTGSPQGGIENLTGGDPLHARMMLEAMYVVRFQVDGALDFIVNYVDLEHLREHIRDVGDPTLAVLFSQLTPAGITEKLRELNGDFDTTIGTAFVHGGARFIDARVTVDPGHTVAESLAKVPGARAEAQAAILIGEGQGGADKARFTGRGAGLKQMAKDLDVDGAAVLGAETARDMAGTINKNADTIVLGGGAMGDFIAAAKVAAGAFQPKPKPADKPEDKENKDAKDS
jgi:hypothetical protein